MKALLAAVALAASVAACGGSSVLPHCEEDEVIVGVGSFEHGTWSEYQCAYGEPNALMPDGVEYLTRPGR